MLDVVVHFLDDEYDTRPPGPTPTVMHVNSNQFLTPSGEDMENHFRTLQWCSWTMP